MERMPGEEVIWTGHPTWKGTLGWYLRAVPVVLIPIVIMYVLRALDVRSGISPGKWWLITIVLLLGVLLIDVLRRWATVYTVTSQRLHIRRGILSRGEQSTRVDRVQNLNTYQTFIERLLNVGALDFDTAGTGEHEANFEFRGVADPHTIARRIEPHLSGIRAGGV